MELQLLNHSYKRAILAIIIAAMFVGILPLNALAEDLVIQDTSGVVRASGDPGVEGKVKFSVMDANGAAADGAEVTLTNSATGQVVSAKSVAGLVEFQGLTPGTWTVASLTPGITFTDVTVGTMIASGAATSGSMLVAGVAVAGIGGVVATGIAIADDNSNNGPEMSPAS